MLDYFTVQSTSANPTAIMVLYTMLLCFLLSTAIGVTYVKTYRGLSYSRNFVHSIILSSMDAAVMMLSIGDRLARGLGMIGALAIIRFRTSFKDPKDIIFMFASLAAGIACGVCSYVIAIIGTTGFCAGSVILYFSPFAHNQLFDGMLRFNIGNDKDDKSQLDDVLASYCKTFSLITLRDMSQEMRIEYAYHISLRRGRTEADFLKELQERIKSIKGVNLMLQERTVEL